MEDARRLLIVVLAAVFILPAASVDDRSRLPALRGFILFADRNTIVERDLATSRERVLQAIDPGQLIEHISYRSERQILYDRTVDGLPSANGPRVSLMTLASTGETSQRVITQGEWPTVIPGSSKFFFFRWSVSRQNFVLMYRDGVEPEDGEYEVDGVSFTLPMPVLPISSHEVVFSADISQSPWLFDIRSRELRRLPIPDCLVELWISDKHRLLCHVMHKNRFAEATLDGELQFLDLDIGYVPLAYIDGDHQVVALSPLIIDAYALVTVDLATYAADRYIRSWPTSGRGGTTWVPQQMAH